jgi:hypothetical protein
MSALPQFSLPQTITMPLLGRAKLLENLNPDSNKSKEILQ